MKITEYITIRPMNSVHYILKEYALSNKIWSIILSMLSKPYIYVKGNW